MLEFKYPYTDTSVLNLDWFLEQFKELLESWDAQKVDYEQFKADLTAEFNTLSGKFDDLDEAFQNLKSFVENYFENLDVQQEINNKLDQMVSDGTLKALLEPMFDEVVSEVDQAITTQNNKINVLETRMDTFTHLTEGSTTGDAELIDARVSFDGVTYTSAGDNIRESDDIINNAITNTQDFLGLERNCVNINGMDISNTSNWTLIYKTVDSISVTRNGTFSTGYPSMLISLEPGSYRFEADFTQSLTSNFVMYKNGSGIQLDNGTVVTIEAGDTTGLAFIPVTGTSTVTDIKLIKIPSDGVLQDLENTTDQLVASMNIAGDILDDIALEAPETLAGTQVMNKAVNSSGVITDITGDTYYINEYSLNPGDIVYITAAANWGNKFYAYYDANDVLVQTSPTGAAGGGTFSIITDERSTVPADAVKLCVNSNIGSTPAACKLVSGYNINIGWNGLKWVVVGDSLTEVNARTTMHYFDYIANKTGINVVNMGVSGTGYARGKENNAAFYQRISSCPSDADVVTIFGSFNDLGSTLPLGTLTDNTDDTIAGCINLTIDNLQSVIPLVNLGIVAPTPWDTTQPSTSGNAYNYVEMLKAICQHRSIPYLDLWRESNLRPWDADFRAVAYTRDGGGGTHPDENGHKLIAPHFKAFLETLLL